MSHSHRFSAILTVFAAALLTAFSGGCDSSSGAGSPLPLSLSGTGGGSGSGTSGTTAAFGVVHVGNTANMTLTIANATGGDLTIDALTFLNTVGAAFSVTTPAAPAPPTTLTAGAGITITIQFAPTAVQSYEATIEVTYQTTNSLTFTLTGSGGLAELSVTPPGTVSIGVTRTNGPSVSRSMVLANTGAFPMDVTALSAPTANFAITTTPPPTLPFTLQANSANTLTVEITYTPTGIAGTYNGTLDVTHTGDSPASPTSIPLSVLVNETGSILAVAPSAVQVDFGVTYKNGPALDATISLTNGGSDPLTASTFTITGGAAGYAFLVAPPGPTVLNPAPTSNSVDLQIRFTPGATAGVITDTLQITHNGTSPASPVSVTLSAVVNANSGLPPTLAGYQPVQPNPGSTIDNVPAFGILPFNFPWIDTVDMDGFSFSDNGWIELDRLSVHFGTTGAELNVFDGSGFNSAPGPDTDVLHAYSSNFDVAAGGTFSHGLTTLSGMQAYIFDWRDVPVAGQTALLDSFQVILYENGDIQWNFLVLNAGTGLNRSIGVGSPLNPAATTVLDIAALTSVASGGINYNAGTGHTLQDDLGAYFAGVDPPVSLNGQTIYYQRLTFGLTFVGWRAFREATP